MQITPHLKNTEEQVTGAAVQVFHTLKDRIIHWNYLPGQRLTEEEICKEFGLSRSPVREALRMLVENGLMDKAPYRGYKVKDLDLRLLKEFYELRLALETYAVAKAAESMPEADWQRLYDFWSIVPDVIPPEGLDLTIEDEKFHETIAAATKNTTLVQHLHSINEKIRFIRMRDYATPSRIRETYAQHRAILHAIREHRIADAQQAMFANIDDAQRNVEAVATEALARAYLRRSSSDHTPGA